MGAERDKLTKIFHGMVRETTCREAIESSNASDVKQFMNRAVENKHTLRWKRHEKRRQKKCCEGGVEQQQNYGHVWKKTGQEYK